MGLRKAGAGVLSKQLLTKFSATQIKYSQSSVNGASEIVESMRKNGWMGEPIDVVEMPDGSFTTLDNTRLVAAKQANIEVQAVVHSYQELLPEDLVDRFTTSQGEPKTWGDALSLRIGKQNKQFRTTYPTGTFDIPAIYS